MPQRFTRAPPMAGGPALALNKETSTFPWLQGGTGCRDAVAPVCKRTVPPPRQNEGTGWAPPSLQREAGDQTHGSGGEHSEPRMFVMAVGTLGLWRLAVPGYSRDRRIDTYIVAMTGNRHLVPWQ